MDEDDAKPDEGAVLGELSRTGDDSLSDRELSEERQRLANERVGQDLGFRRWMFGVVLVLMSVEVLALVVIVLLQGFNTGGFVLDEWVLVGINAGILLQTFGLAQVITKALFPPDRR